MGVYGDVNAINKHRGTKAPNQTNPVGQSLDTTRTEGESGGEGGGGVGLREALLQPPDAPPACLPHGHAHAHLLHHQEGQAHPHDLLPVARRHRGAPGVFLGVGVGVYVVL